MLYPLKFRPILKQKIWGGDRLGQKSPDHPSHVGESWEISAVEDNLSVVANGLLAENNIQELIEVYMGELVGDKVYDRFGIEFPLLIKYIDAQDNLSIQVHPDDETARERHKAYGKTEMWYVVDALPGASLSVGFNRDVEQSDFLRALHWQRLPELLHTEPVKKGDVFFIPPGTIHSINRGCLIAEIQQTSDITYRVYDYNRPGADGLPRELHTDLALDIMNYHPVEHPRVQYSLSANQPSRLVQCPYFTTNLLQLDRDIERDYVRLDSFVIYMCLEGRFTITTGESDAVLVNRGETVLLPACFKNINLYPDELTRLLEIYID